MRNVLVQYQGGGYDGCYWEWNFFYFDKDGVFYDIGSSGRQGCETEEKARQLLAKNESTTYTYDFSTDAGWRELCKECHPGLIIGIFNWFEQQNDSTITPFVVCSVCGEDTSEPKYEPEYGPDGIVCSDCWSTCDNCGYYSKEFREYENECLCLDCIEYKEKEKQREKQQDMLHSAFATGKPNLFGNEMRWYWN